MSDLTVDGADIETVEEGYHTVTVLELEPRETDFGVYVDFKLDIEDSEYKGLKFGVPMKSEITGSSLLGKLIAEVTGEPVQAGASYDLKDIFEGEQLELEVIENSDGFPEVVKTKDDKLAIAKA